MGDKPQPVSQSGRNDPGQSTSKPKPITWTQKDAAERKRTNQLPRTRVTRVAKKRATR
jgi:hypothetical protein